jgi:hypothetical protein
MFKKYWIGLTWLWLFLVLGCFGFFYIFSDATKEYQRLMGESERIKKKHLQEEARTTQQTRYQVSKQILYKKDLHRLQSRLVSESSDLIYSKEKGELVERFKGLICAMQEKMIDASNHEGDEHSSTQPQQMIRQLKAKEAVYYYQSGQLEAEEVEIAHYLLPGYLWLNSFDSFLPLLQGRAHTMQLSLFEGPYLKVQGFQAIFHSWREEW